MPDLVLKHPMAKSKPTPAPPPPPPAEPKKMGRPSTGLDLVSIKIERSIQEQIAVIADEDGVPRSVLLSDLLRDEVERRYLAALEAKMARLKASKVNKSAEA